MPDFRWTPTSNLHLTIRFIGSVERERVEGIADRLDALMLPGFDLEAGDLGAFKRGRLARVVWLGLRSGSEAAGELAAVVEAECRSAGFPAEARPFQAHMTLARARKRDGSVLQLLPALPKLPAWRATGLVLYSSRLTRAGAVYEPIRTVSLK